MQELDDPATRPTVLIVDDTPENLALASSILKVSYRAKVATSGERALQIAFSQDPPDLILLDIMMPEMDGYEVCRRLKTDERTCDIPIIFLTAKTSTEDEKMGFELGAVDYITKPISPPIVMARVKTHLALQRQRRTLQDNYRQLQNLEELRDNLVHMLVHDLRSPLTSIIGHLDLLETYETDSLTDEGKDLVRITKSSAATLVKMISSVLDVSRMESGQMMLDLAECEMKNMAGEAIARLAALKKDRKFTLKAPSDPIRINADPDLVTRVIQNLLANAFKFTPQAGEITLTIEPYDDHVRASVRDNGSGIPEEFRDKVFDKFCQVDARQKGHQYSTGLGLTFCKLAVEAHGGSIGVESDVGKGSTFWFELPISGPARTKAPQPETNDIP
jgi:two-component system, sensor histidine kinase and response regulator